MKKLTAKFLYAVVGIVALVSVNTAQARPIIETLDVLVIEGIGRGTRGSIQVAYDETALSLVGFETLFDPDVALTLDLFGQTFTNSNDVLFLDNIGLPAVDFFDGVIDFIDFAVSELDFFNPTDIVDSRVGLFGGGNVVGGTWEVTALAVPLPGTLAMFAMGMLGWAVSRRPQAKRLS